MTILFVACIYNWCCGVTLRTQLNWSLKLSNKGWIIHGWVTASGSGCKGNFAPLWGDKNPRGVCISQVKLIMSRSHIAILPGPTTDLVSGVGSLKQPLVPAHCCTTRLYWVVKKLLLIQIVKLNHHWKFFKSPKFQFIQISGNIFFLAGLHELLL